MQKKGKSERLLRGYPSVNGRNARWRLSFLSLAGENDRSQHHREAQKRDNLWKGQFPESGKIMALLRSAGKSQVACWIVRRDQPSDYTFGIGRERMRQEYGKRWTEIVDRASIVSVDETGVSFGIRLTRSGDVHLFHPVWRSDVVKCFLWFSPYEWVCCPSIPTTRVYWINSFYWNYYILI